MGGEISGILAARQWLADDMVGGGRLEQAAPAPEYWLA